MENEDIREIRETLLSNPVGEFHKDRKRFCGIIRAILLDSFDEREATLFFMERRDQTIKPAITRIEAYAIADILADKVMTEGIQRLDQYDLCLISLHHVVLEAIIVQLLIGKDSKAPEKKGKAIKRTYKEVRGRLQK